MHAEPTGTPEQLPSGIRSRRKRWDPSYAAVAVTLTGGVVYTFLRFAYTLFYAAFHTTPEEVGLSYSQTIVRGVIPSITIAASAFMVTALLLFGIITLIGYFVVLVNAYRGYRYYKHSLSQFKVQVRRDSQSSPSLAQFQAHSLVVWTHLKQRYPSTTRIMLGSYGLPEDDFVAGMGASDAADEAAGSESAPPLKGSQVIVSTTIEGWRIFWRTLFHKATLFILLALTLVALATLIRYQAFRVNEGHSLGPTLSILTGLRAEKATVNAVETGKYLPTELKARPVIYLGESNGTTLFFVPQNGRTIRIPSSNIIVQFHNQ
jgi:hypothetical protein